jgi:Leucine-rich repeat (LRR) protein
MSPGIRQESAAERRCAALLSAALLPALVLFTAIFLPVAPVKAAADPQPANPPSVSNHAGAVDTNVPPDERRVSLTAQQMPLQDALAQICRQAKLELDLDAAGLEMAGVKTNAPVTVEFKDEPLTDAVAGILNSRGVRSIGQVSYLYREMRGEKLLVSSIQALQARNQQEKARALQNLPDWLKPLFLTNGFSVALDDDRNVISISAYRKVDDALLARLKTLPKLRELNLETTTPITSQGLACLADLPALEKLYLYHVTGEGGQPPGDAALQAASHIKTLRDFSADGCQVTDDGLKALAAMTQLTSLSLNGNCITDAGLSSLAGLTNLSNLDLSGSPWVNSHMQITDEGMKHLSRLTELRRLSVSGRGIAISGAGLSFPRLQSLALGGEKVTDAALDSITQCRDLGSLTLNWTGISDSGLKRIAGLGELRYLMLDSDRIGDAGIASLKALPKLDTLQLRVALLSDEALRHVSQIKSLRRLDLWGGTGAPFQNSGQFITIEGLQQLKDLPQLRYLTINNFESPDGYLGLRQLKGLRSLDLNFSSITDAEVELLEAAMPDTIVTAMREIMMIKERPERPPLPADSVFLSGRAVDDTTGLPVAKCELQFGAPDPAGPGQIAWGQPANSPIIEVSGNGSPDPGHFWGESFRAGKVWARLIAAGYQPFPFTPNPALSPLSAPLRMTNIMVRMKTGGDLRGVVVDHDGHPLPDLRVYLVGPYFSLRDGVPGSLSKGGTAITDSAGRFTLPGGNGTEQKVLVASADGHMAGIDPKVGPDHEAAVSLPQPATLIVRYDIPDDAPVAQVILNFESFKLDPALWKDVSLGLNPLVTNRAELVLTNLLPGPYHLMRRKTLTVGGTARGGRARGGSASGPASRGQRIVWLEDSSLSLEPGQTQQVNWVRPSGQAIRGQVDGIAETGAPGAYIYVFSSESTNTPAEMVIHDRPLDALTCGEDGQFQTAQLPPGAFTLVALAFKEPASPVSRGEPDFVGSVNVAIITNTAPPPVKIALLPQPKRD